MLSRKKKVLVAALPLTISLSSPNRLLTDIILNSFGLQNEL